MKMAENNAEFIKPTKNILSFPYEGKTKKFYFIYAGLFWVLAFLVYASSLFIITNLTINNKYSVDNNVNIFVTPLFNLFLITVSLILLLIAPIRAHHNTKQSSVMFYISFWFLVISTLLNSQLQLNYIEDYRTTNFYNWISEVVIKAIIIISVISLFFVQVYFWVMRRKFTFMPTDYEIYTNRSEIKNALKAVKSEKKLAKKHIKLQKKIKKTNHKKQLGE